MWGLFRLGLFFLLNTYHLSFFPLGPTPPDIIIIIMRIPSSYSSPDGAPFTGEGLKSTRFSQPISHQAVLGLRS